MALWELVNVCGVQLKSYQIEPLYCCILFDYYFCNGGLVSSVECIVVLFGGQIRDVAEESFRNKNPQG